MVKSGAERAEKYGQKFDAEVVRARYAATADSAKAKQVTKQQHLADIAGEVRGILNLAGEFPIVTVLYLSFANKLYAVVERFAGGYATPVESDTAIAVANSELIKWLLMGGKYAVLKSVWEMFPIALGACPDCPLINPEE